MSAVPKPKPEPRLDEIDLQRRSPAQGPGDFFQHVLDQDTRPVPDVLRLRGPLLDAPVEVPVENYTSRAIHDLEVQRLWKRVWQMACREEEIPEVGDTHVYEVAHLQYIVVRVAPDRIKAYPNACLHRGRQLVDGPGRNRKLRCPYHGFTWSLNGELADVPSAWDFPQIANRDEWRLPEAQVGTWGGFVFINPDPKAQPLSEFLGDIDRHYERYPLDQRYIAGHAAKVLPCNWKMAQEAFLEAYHVFATHPQLAPQSAHHDTQVDVFGNFSRAMIPSMLPSSSIRRELTEQEIVDAALDTRMDGTSLVPLPPGTSARRKMVDVSREALRAVIGDKAEMYCDSELVDTFFNNVFPNIHPWATYSRIFFRFRPYRDDPDRCIQDVYILSPFKGERPPAAQVHVLGEDEDWTKAPEIGVFLGRILNQDVFNMLPCQNGLKATHRRTVTYANYQEGKVRHFHKLWSQWVHGAD